MIVNGEQKKYIINDETFHCGVAVCHRYIGGKWKAIIVWYLRYGFLRFSEIKREIPDITEKMLSIQLKSLQEDGIIDKKIIGTKAPFRVEYSLTDMGKTLIPVIGLINEWGTEFANKKGKLVDVL